MSGRPWRRGARERAGAPFTAGAPADPGPSAQPVRPARAARTSGRPYVRASVRPNLRAARTPGGPGGPVAQLQGERLAQRLSGPRSTFSSPTTALRFSRP
ncbi:hypothetical protein GCM10018781_60170 [Kitasatospora indigofera]|uniref:Uncharacterized protein n=1 Tax=Kitasatospora indigofera TaxID=67307 RepID=A0A919G8T3_9ACTN|nr:hypothetical protein GCM10018781_60170 [Kitasatospora indigofera]